MIPHLSIVKYNQAIILNSPINFLVQTYTTKSFPFVHPQPSFFTKTTFYLIFLRSILFDFFPLLGLYGVINDVHSQKLSVHYVSVCQRMSSSIHYFGFDIFVFWVKYIQLHFISVYDFVCRTFQYTNS